MSKHRRRLHLAGCALAAIAAVALVGCPKPRSGGKVIPADRIAAAGHGQLLDASFKVIQVDARVAAEIQASLLQVVQAGQVSLDDKSQAAIDQAQALLKEGQLDGDEQVLLRGAIIGRHLRHASPALRERYDWRNRALVTHYLSLRPELMEQLRDLLRERLRDLGFFDPPTGSTPTSYMNDCAAHDVPVPPDWAEAGTAWQLQGNLAENILVPGDVANVWTYHDPDKRGGCIALPRGSGRPGSAAGIICQSATTGHACFWDNKRRGVEPEQFLGWSGQTLVIADLKDGSNLDSACTGCHVGNNVFRISPDDATWARVLRGDLPRTTTFTTRVEASSDNQGGRPRYIPITTLPPRAGWDNPFVPAGYCQDCHELKLGDSLTPRRMPPACATGPSDPAGCYAP